MKTLYLFVLFSVALMGQALTPSSFLSTVDKDRLRRVFQSALGHTDDIPSVHYAILGYKLLGETAPNAQDLCKKLQAKLSDATLVNIYQASTAAEAIGCKLLSQGQNSVTQVLSAAISADASISNLFHAVLAQKALGQKVDSANVLKFLQAALKKDDSLLNLGYAFHVAAILDGDVKTIFDRIEDAIVQADEVDGKMLQFEGGLTVTNLILTGAYKLSTKVGKAPPISKMQSVKFANYFLSRKSVQAAKGAYFLLDALTALTNNKFHIPVAVTLASQATVSESSPKVQVRVNDLLGKSLGKMDVTIESAMRQSDGAVIMSKSKMNTVEEGLFEVDMMSAKPGKGFYELSLTATPSKADNRLVGNAGALLLVKALSSVAVEGVEIGVGDADQSTAPRLNRIGHPDKLKTVLEADHHHKVILKFTLKDKASNEKIKAHQTFVRLADPKTGAEIIFVAEPDSNMVYKFDLDVNTKAKEFGSRSGVYEMHLIVGDAVISNAISWHLGDINLKFSDASEELPAAVKNSPLRPEIKHMFREPEKRPPQMVSNAFTLLCLAPFLLMLGLWLKIGVNISAFPFSLSALGFHLGLGGIFTLYYYFWLELNMFTTVKYLMMLGVATFLCGNSMLAKIAEKRKQ